MYAIPTDNWSYMSASSIGAVHGTHPWSLGPCQNIHIAGSIDAGVLTRHSADGAYAKWGATASHTFYINGIAH